jgi:hypothetical protein
MTSIVVGPDGRTLRRSKTLQAVVMHAVETKPQHVRCDHDLLLLVITFADGSVGMAEFPTSADMEEWIVHRKTIFREVRYEGRALAA